MKRTLIALLIMILARITCFSSTTLISTDPDSIVSVTASDLKYANLIFVEHSKLLKENSLLYQQVGNYVELNNQLTQIDSLRLQQINEYDKLSQSYATQIDALSKEVKKKNKAIRYWQIGGVTVSVGLVLFLLLK